MYAHVCLVSARGRSIEATCLISPKVVSCFLDLNPSADEQCGYVDDVVLVTPPTLAPIASDALKPLIVTKCHKTKNGSISWWLATLVTVNVPVCENVSSHTNSGYFRDIH